MDITSQQIAVVATASPIVKTLIEPYGDDRKQRGTHGAQALDDRFSSVRTASDIPGSERTSVRNDLNRFPEQWKTVTEVKGISDDDEKRQSQSTAI